MTVTVPVNADAAVVVDFSEASEGEEGYPLRWISDTVQEFFHLLDID